MTDSKIKDAEQHVFDKWWTRASIGSKILATSENFYGLKPPTRKPFFKPWHRQ